METVCNQVTEDGDSNGEVGLEEEQLTAAGHDFLSETAEATGFLIHLNSTEPTDEEQAEQTGPSLIQTSIFKSHYHADATLVISAALSSALICRSDRLRAETFV